MVTKIKDLLDYNGLILYTELLKAYFKGIYGGDMRLTEADELPEEASPGTVVQLGVARQSEGKKYPAGTIWIFDGSSWLPTTEPATGSDHKIYGESAKAHAFMSVSSGTRVALLVRDRNGRFEIIFHDGRSGETLRTKGYAAVRGEDGDLLLCATGDLTGAKYEYAFKVLWSEGRWEWADESLSRMSKPLQLKPIINMDEQPDWSQAAQINCAYASGVTVDCQTATDFVLNEPANGMAVTLSGADPAKQYRFTCSEPVTGLVFSVRGEETEPIDVRQGTCVTVTGLGDGTWVASEDVPGMYSGDGSISCVWDGSGWDIRCTREGGSAVLSKTLHDDGLKIGAVGIATDDAFSPYVAHKDAGWSAADALTADYNTSVAAMTAPNMDMARDMALKAGAEFTWSYAADETDKKTINVQQWNNPDGFNGKLSVVHAHTGWDAQAELEKEKNSDVFSNAAPDLSMVKEMIRTATAPEGWTVVTAENWDEHIEEANYKWEKIGTDGTKRSGTNALYGWMMKAGKGNFYFDESCQEKFSGARTGIMRIGDNMIPETAGATVGGNGDVVRLLGFFRLIYYSYRQYIYDRDSGWEPHLTSYHPDVLSPVRYLYGNVMNHNAGGAGPVNQSTKTADWEWKAELIRWNNVWYNWYF
jgi:hypothetical protein